MRKTCLLNIVIFFTSVSFSNTARKTGIKAVTVTFGQSLEKDEEVYYSLTPLLWQDFSGIPDSSSQWAAMTHSGIRLKYEYQEKGDTTIANVMLYPYMAKGKSWYKPEGHNPYTLAHEQRHFDITAIVANELAREIKSAKFDLVDFPTAIISMHSKYIKKLEAMQAQYDEETAHGDNYAVQQKWNARLSDEIASLGVYK